MGNLFEGLLKKRSGVATFDLLFATIPVILMLGNILVFSALAEHKAESDINLLTKEGRLLAVSDYVVEYAGVEKNGGFGFSASYYPNLIDGGELGAVDVAALEQEMGLENLEIGWDADGRNCIYRLVVYNENIAKLYFCAD
ncbi:MAG: hypothetical protein WC350_02715 [Candidatus Micrarchaeia archaeon]|jgi:hypothetical protein